MRLSTVIDSLVSRFIKPGAGADNQQPDGKFYGKYRGVVLDNQDPETLGRARLRVPSVLGKEPTGWALPCTPYGGKSAQGFFMVPDTGANVWVEFEEGDVSKPIWTGTFWQQPEDVPEEAAVEPPNTRLLQTASGHTLLLNDDGGNEQVRLRSSGGAEIVMDEQGSISLQDHSGAVLKLDADASEITLEDANGNTLMMNSAGTRVEDANGHVIDMASAGISVEAAKVVIKSGTVELGDEGGEPLIKGQSFLSLFASHIHTCAPVVGGPTSPPIPQGESTALSTTVKTI